MFTRGYPTRVPEKLPQHQEVQASLAPPSHRGRVASGSHLDGRFGESGEQSATPKKWLVGGWPIPIYKWMMTGWLIWWKTPLKYGWWLGNTGWWYTYPSEKIWKSVGMMTFPAEWNIIHSCSKPPTRVSNISEFHGYPQSIIIYPHDSHMIATISPWFSYHLTAVFVGSPRWRCSCSLASASCHPWSNNGDGFNGNNGESLTFRLGDVDFWCWLPYLHWRFSRDF